MSIKEPIQLKIITNSLEIHEAFKQRMSGALLDSIAGLKFCAVSSESDGKNVKVHLQQFFTLSEIKPDTAWTGEGLPPIGIECERMWVSGPASYTRVRVIAHDDGQAIYRFTEDRRKGQVQADKQGDGDSCGNPIFRPIRTPEQIAAEEREAKAKAMWQAVYFNTDPAYWDRAPEGTRDTFRAAIDAGWQQVKQ